MKSKSGIKKINYVNLLNAVFIFAIIIFIWLSLLGSASDFSSLVINLILFITVFCIFNNAKKVMRQIDKITDELNLAANRIETEFEATNSLLWDQYQDDGISELFANEILSEKYAEYLSERKRVTTLSNDKYKCDISDYINEELIDSTMKKNVYNLVPGVMTGLGILGTFIGLSIGLKNFNTGSTQEIEDSIAPLMNGIKIAFHTSIYGMLFSLVFNFVYKEVLEYAYVAVNNFLEKYDRYVEYNATDDNQVAVHQLLQNMPIMVSTAISDVLSPAMDKMNDTLEHLTNDISTNQLEGLSEIVDHFIEAMDSSMGDSFKALGETIDKTIEMQEKNSQAMDNILHEIQDMTKNIMDMNELSSQTVEETAQYVEKLDSMQAVINDNFKCISEQLEYQKEYDDRLREYIDILVNYERQIGEASNRFTEDMSKQLELLGTMENKISESTRENLEMLAKKAEEYNKSLTEVAKQELQSVLNMTQEYSQNVTNHLNTLTEEAEKQVKAIVNLSANHTNDLEQASKTLAEVSRELDGKLTVALNSAFTAIDDNLAEISRHLSGTISEIEETTDRVPQVVQKSYSGMKDGFDEMNSKIKMIVNSLDKMAKELEIKGSAD